MTDSISPNLLSHSLMSASIQNDPAAYQHWVIILAAGLSTRLGEPKQLLTIQGRPLIRHMSELALATKPQGLIVVIPQNDSKIAAALKVLTVTQGAELAHKLSTDLAIKIVRNPTPQLGMALSLSLAIDNLRTGMSSWPVSESTGHTDDLSVLIMSIDQVRLSHAHLQQLLSTQQDNANSIVTTSRYQDIIGLPLVVKGSTLQDWQSSLSGDKGLRHLIRALPAKAVQSIDAPELAHDIDTPEQLHLARSQGWLDA